MNSNCQSCSLNGRSHLNGGDGFAETSQYVFITEAPDAFDIAKQRVLVGQAGQLLRQTLMQIDSSLISKSYFTNLLLCRPIKKHAVPTDAIAACNVRLQDELNSILHKRVIIAFGTVVMQQLVEQHTESITKSHGIPIWSNKYSCYIMPIIDPAEVLQKPALFRDFADDLQFAMAKIPDHKVADVIVPAVHVCDTNQKVADAISYIRQQLASAKDAASKPIVCDIETTSLDALTGKILSVMIMIDLKNAYVFTDRMMRTNTAIKQLFEDDSILWAGHNASQFDAEFLMSHYAIDWYPRFDTLLAHYAINEQQGGHSLKTLARKLFFAADYGAEMKPLMKQGILDTASPDVLYKYQALDCYYTLKLIAPLKKQMAEQNTTRVHDNILIPLAHTFRDIELYGVYTDKQYLLNLQNDLQQQLATAKTYMVQQAEQYDVKDFNPNSPKQVASLFYDHMHLVSDTRKTDRAALAALHNELADKVLQYRITTKMLNTFVKGLLTHIDVDNRIHANFLLFGTRTGRLSCQNPNLHNIPSFMTSSIIKRAFATKSKDWCIVVSDYSQLELRIAAWLSNDKKLIDTFKQGKDFHRIVAAEMFNVKAVQVDARQRYIAKCVGFGILYGRSARSLVDGWSRGKDPKADQLFAAKWTISMAQDYIDKFLGTYATLYNWIQTQHAKVRQNHYIETPFGRRRRFPLISRVNISQVLRQAVNFSTQSTASDICQLALMKLHKKLRKEDARIVMTVHDSIIFEVRKAVLDDVIETIRDTMQTYPDQLEARIPLKVSIDYGETWGDVKEYKKEGTK